MLKQRILTAIVLIVVFVSAVLYLHDNAFALFAGAIAVLGCWEWSRLARIESLVLRLSYTVLVALIGLGLLYSGQILHTNLLLYIGSLFWLPVIVLMVGDPVTAGEAMKPRSYSMLCALIGVLLLVTLWVAMVRLHALPGGEYHLLGMCLLVWLADTGAFFTGRALGRHKLAPRVSPAKTIEGVIGGVIAAMLAALAWPYMNKLPGISQLAFMLVAALTVIASVYGDLLESVFKRIRGIKDSGKLLPGHGGILDRIDSLIAAAPVFMSGLLLLGSPA